MAYDHSREVRSKLDRAVSAALRLEAEARHIHRLCSRGGTEPCCGMLPGSTSKA